MLKESKSSLSVSRIKEVLSLPSKSKNVEKSKESKVKGKKSTKIIKRKNVDIKDKKTLKNKKHKNQVNKNKKVNLLVSNKPLSNPLCDTCLKITKSQEHPGTLISKNVEDWKEANMHIPLLGNSNTKDCQEVHIDMGKKNAGRLIYYFAAKSIASKGIKKYPNVYKGSTNNGLIVLDKTGCGIAKVDCPSVYLDVSPKNIIKKGSKLQAYMNHIHYIISDKNMTKWEDKMYTQNVLCKISKSEYEMSIKQNFRVVLNALEPKYNIPGTDGNLLYKEAEKMTTKKVREFVYRIASNKTEKHKKMLKTCNVINIPIVVYCHNPECTAAKHLATTLYKAGFYNIVYYSGGFLGYHGR